MYDNKEITDLVTTLHSIRNLVRDYEEEIKYHQSKWAITQDEKMGNLMLTKITNCEGRIRYNKRQYETILKQLKEII